MGGQFLTTLGIMTMVGLKSGNALFRLQFRASEQKVRCDISLSLLKHYFMMISQTCHNQSWQTFRSNLKKLIKQDKNSAREKNSETVLVLSYSICFFFSFYFTVIKCLELLCMIIITRHSTAAGNASADGTRSFAPSRYTGD